MSTIIQNLEDFRIPVNRNGVISTNQVLMMSGIQPQSLYAFCSHLSGSASISFRSCAGVNTAGTSSWMCPFPEFRLTGISIFEHFRAGRVPAVYLKLAIHPFLLFLRFQRINKLHRMKGGE